MKRGIVLDPRKKPRQDRSRQMREDILAASVRVLQREGPLRFTTPRVAKAAGISVGSLYQYFPNKHALVFALHQRSVEETWIEVQRILDHGRWSAREKIRRLARLSFLAESEETLGMGAALQDAELFFADQPEYRVVREVATRRLSRFIRDSLPSASASRSRFNAQLLMTVLESVGRSVASLKLRRSAVITWSRACADMIAGYLGLP